MWSLSSCWTARERVVKEKMEEEWREGRKDPTRPKHSRSYRQSHQASERKVSKFSSCNAERWVPGIGKIVSRRELLKARMHHINVRTLRQRKGGNGGRRVPRTVGLKRGQIASFFIILEIAGTSTRRNRNRRRLSRVSPIGVQRADPILTWINRD